MLRSYVKGALSYVLPSARNSHVDRFPVSAELSYSKYLRHLVLRSQFKALLFGETVAELGPGSSLGFGLAALISGAGHYQSYDVSAHSEIDANLRIFDRLVELFGTRAPIPHEGEFVRIFPYVDDPAFPTLLSTSWMERALASERLAQIRRDLMAGGGATIASHIGGYESARDRRADWIASHSVLEHVDDLEGVYRFMKALAARGAVMTHLIDFSSHGLTDEWNGHWTIGAAQWSLLRGRRTYLINREPLSTHLDMLAAQGARIVDKRLHRRVDGVLKERFAPEFGQMTSLDASTHMAFIVALAAGETPAAA